MSMTNGISIFFAALFSGFLAWSVLDSRSRDQGGREGLRYSSFLGGVSLPVLLLLLPFFRRYISARGCACLWMLPNILYLSQAGFMSQNHPIWIISLPNSLLKPLTILWLAGFAAVLLYKLLEHFVFRAQIMRNAVPVQEETVLALWKQEQTNAGFAKPNYKLLCSPAVKTPLSIGLLKLTTRVILPDTEYSPEELRMIFRHELVHICRSDAWTKFSLTFCTAVCWFNPFMWISVRKSFDDLELSCDETVLLQADDDQRRRYAELLLKTAGQEQGFTTCLSASASALRYRLKNTVKPRRRRSGALTVGLVSFLLLITCGNVALAYETGSGRDAIFSGLDPAACTLSSVRDMNVSSHRTYICTDPERLMDYLCQLPVQKLTGNYDFFEDSPSLVLLYDTPKGTLGIDLNDHSVGVTRFWGEHISQERLSLPEELDWDYLDTLLPQMPAVNIRLTGPDDTNTDPASIDTVTKISNGRSELLTEPLPDESWTGIYGNIDFQTMELEFPEPPISHVQVTMYSWDWSRSETLTLHTPDQVIELPSNALHLKIAASFDGPNGSIYETVFRYEIQADDSGSQ